MSSGFCIRSRFFLFACILAAIMAVLTQPVTASPPFVVSAPSFSMAPSTTESFDVLVSGGLVPGVSFRLQIGDGSSGPIIESAAVRDIGHVFNPSNSSAEMGSALPAWKYLSDVGAYSPVLANGVLATVTVNTVGVAVGAYPIHLYIDTEDGPTPTCFGEIYPELVDGIITVTPEPASVLLLLAGGCVVALRRRRR